MEAPTGAYRGYLRKIELADKRRTKPFSEAVMNAIRSADEITDVLGGDMQLPGGVEAQLLVALVEGTRQQGGRLLDAWALLDMVLIARYRSPGYTPAWLIGEMMLKAQTPVAFVDGKNVTVAQMFEEDYARWSTGPDPDVVAGNHFNYGNALLAESDDEAVGCAFDQFALAAKHPAHTSNAAERISKVLEAAPKKKLVSDASGFTYELNPQATDSASKVLVNGKPVGQASDEGDSTALIVGAFVAFVAIAVTAWAVAKKAKKH
eukprot:CAMPEP_0174831262 /NCGR_PEP_ID=MMETSP1114-20130205/2996_1 /TAXON_ID=312471 /ORGANISM="Neobodo designis, Strain CCAP 1951/1" /LENGTH=262 /DNA_ID=CAMNT_0016065083 /DNA_START=29 /DNA_END=817 /DNA_ORIENTATION=+